MTFKSLPFEFSTCLPVKFDSGDKGTNPTLPDKDRSRDYCLVDALTFCDVILIMYKLSFHFQILSFLYEICVELVKFPQCFGNNGFDSAYINQASDSLLSALYCSDSQIDCCCCCSYRNSKIIDILFIPTAYTTYRAVGFCHLSLF